MALLATYRSELPLVQRPRSKLTSAQLSQRTPHSESGAALMSLPWHFSCRYLLGIEGEEKLHGANLQSCPDPGYFDAFPKMLHLPKPLDLVPRSGR